MFAGFDMYFNMFKGVAKVLCCCIVCLTMFECVHLCLNIMLQVFGCF